MDEIKTEDELMAVLSSPGRYMMLIERDDDDETYEAYVIRQHPETKTLCSVDYDFARQWADQHDINDPMNGPFCSSWSIPEFAPDVSANEPSDILEINTEDDLDAVLGVIGYTLEREWFMDPAEVPEAWMWVIREGGKTVGYVDTDVGNKWAAEHPEVK